MSWSWAEIAFGRTRLRSRTVHWEEIGKRIARAFGFWGRGYLIPSPCLTGKAVELQMLISQAIVFGQLRNIKP
jgi:hypothetical protein